MRDVPDRHKTRIIMHPKVALFKRPGFLKEFSFKDFAKEEFLRKDIPDGEKFLSLVQTERHIRKVKKACQVKDRLAEMDLTPEYHEIVCLEVCLEVGTVIRTAKEGNFAIVSSNLTR